MYYVPGTTLVLGPDRKLSTKWAQCNAIMGCRLFFNAKLSMLLRLICGWCFGLKVNLESWPLCTVYNPCLGSIAQSVVPFLARLCRIFKIGYEIACVFYKKLYYKKALCWIISIGTYDTKTRQRLETSCTTRIAPPLQCTP